MAVPTSFDESNHVLDPPPGVQVEACAPLSVFVDGKHVISCWKLTQAELDEVNRTGRIWLWLWGKTMPPAYVSPDYPFKQVEEPG